ncbi:MAG TPA: hypothetical protein VMU94_13660 [Streptosporangiaceae bacterium]|nr:hypothetical protein [Streptosporangiaceae bacterium]
MSADGQVTARRKPTVTVIPVDRAVADGRPAGSPAKPTLARLQVDLVALDWQRSGTEAGSFEVAFISGAGPGRADWVLLRVAGDPGGRVLVYDRTEWLCFIDGAGHGEFDWPAELTRVRASAAAVETVTAAPIRLVPSAANPRRSGVPWVCAGHAA